MGTYCKADLKEGRGGGYKMILTGLHRVHIESIYKNTIDTIEQMAKNDTNGDRILLEDVEADYNDNFGQIECLKNLEQFTSFIKSKIF